MAEEDDLLKEAHEAFDRSSESESKNREQFLDDKKFAFGNQWPDRIVQDRMREGRPCLTINKIPSFTRQVINDSRQNKPSVKVHPVDSDADPLTAKVLDGVIRNIEYTSSADVAYDTAIENAVTGGFGYWRVKIDYSCDDTFDLDLLIDRVPDPLLVYGDPFSTAADSSDWNTAFVVEHQTTDEFKRKWPKAKKVNWQDDYSRLGEPWYAKNSVMVAEWWRRVEVERQIVLMSDGSVLDAEQLKSDQDLQAFLQQTGVTVVKERPAKSYKVSQTILTGAEVLETTDWPGKFIPIVPVYGDEVWIDGERRLKSLIRDAKDAQRMYNYWRTTTTELIALAPKTPFIGPKGAFKTDVAKWATANTQSHPYIEFDGGIAPQRQPFVGVPAGAIQEALNANDDMKATMGLFDASLGARSNETSGIAINARQREGDVSTFHFIDNLARAIRHTGRILLDLIPHVYSERRILRVIGEDGTPSHVPQGQPVPVTGPDGQPAMQAPGVPLTKIYDLTAGKYDLTVSTGPSFTTRRQEAAAQMTELMRAFPAAAPVVGPLLAKNLDWPGADEIAQKLDQMTQGQQGQIPPQMQQAIGKLQQTLQQVQQENTQLQQENAALKQNAEIKAQEVQVKGFEAQTDRMRAIHEATQPPQVRQPGA